MRSILRGSAGVQGPGTRRAPRQGPSRGLRWVAGVVLAVLVLAIPVPSRADLGPVRFSSACSLEGGPGAFLAGWIGRNIGNLFAVVQALVPRFFRTDPTQNGVSTSGDPAAIGTNVALGGAGISIGGSPFLPIDAVLGLFCLELAPSDPPTPLAPPPAAEPVQ